MNTQIYSRRMLLFGGLGTLFAKDLVDPVNRDRKGVAAKGYDVVAYFKEQRAVRGSAAYTHDWMGATFRFSSAGNRDAFAAEPEKYAPQFGGYCAWAVGHGYTAPIDPEAWTVVNGKLYLNYSKGVQKDWLPDKEKWIAAGERNWPGPHR